ncbi:MAG TPA: SNF2-related protein [Thermoanaerobaculia bacterium]|jgi:ATP-dependent helicase HepA|nr:SNF2-related protein [Thermoanaerobaculia bacterium]
MWKPGDRLTHRFNPELGPGQVVEISGRNVVVRFPDSDQTLSLATGSDALVPLVLVPGAKARLEGTNETVVVAACEGGVCRLEDGREVPVSDLWPLPAELPPAERLARGQVDSYDDFLNRLDGLRLQRIRQAGGLGSFLGGRIQIFPHQLYAAERACHSDPVRWLLADEVGLGKTVEACLILNRLLQTGRADRTLIVAPETLTLQWLGELWRKYHQVFVLLDEKRLADVARDHGADFNPFDVHRRVIVGLDTLASRRRLTEQAVEAGIDLLVVDEAHHLRRPPGHPGSEAYRAVAPIAALGRHVLLLTATPLEDDAHGFFRLLQLLRPEEFPEEESFADRLARREPLPPCTSSARRADIGGLPPRVGFPIELDDPGWEPLRRLERLMRSLPADNPLAERRKADRIVRALSSPAAVAAVLDRTEREDPELTFLLPEAERSDPRVKWLTEQAAKWQQAGEKTLVFVAHRETLERLKAAVEREGRARAGLFHEDLPPERRDIEVAQFRLPEGPALMISTEAGGEGRNFEFCRRLILFDLPWNPAVVEQRIGRLDRIGRTIPTEIVYFRPPSGLGRAVAGLYEAIGLFEEPLGGMERELRHVARAVERESLQGPDEVDPAVSEGVLREAQEAHDRVRNAAYHELHRDPYRPEMVEEILSRVPPDLDLLNESVVLRAAGRFGFLLEPQTGRGDRDVWAIEFGWEALVDHIPGVPPGSRYLGTFDRAEAVERETLDFFASGHPLVEGVLWELEDGPRGQVALFQVAGGEEVFGLLAIYRRGVDFEVVAVDNQGRRRPDLAERLTAKGVITEPVEAKKWTGQAGWGKVVRRMAAALPEGKPQAVAAFRVRKSG